MLTGELVKFVLNRDLLFQVLKLHKRLRNKVNGTNEPKLITKAICKSDISDD